MDAPELGTHCARGLPQRTPPPEEAVEADGSVRVHVRAHIMQLTSIDSREQVFQAALWLQVCGPWLVVPCLTPPLQLRWQVRVPPDKLGSLDNGDWTPEVTFLNCEAKKPDDRRLRILPSAVGSSMILTYTIKGIWHHLFDLRQFPVDTQTLLLRGVLWRNAQERVVDVDAASGKVLHTELFHGRVRFELEPCQLYKDSFTHSDVWRVSSRPVLCRQGHSDDTYRGAEDGQRFTTLDVEVTLKRKPLFYITNVVLPFFLFVCLSFMSFGVEIDAPGFGGLLSDRSSLTLNMVLTAAAFKVVVANYTPAVSYLTYLDIYVLLCFIVMCAVSLQNYAVSSAPDVPTAKRWNRIGAIILTCSFAAMQLLVPAAMIYANHTALNRNLVRSAKHVKNEARRRHEALKYRQTTVEGRSTATVRVQLEELKGFTAAKAEAPL